MPSARWFPRFGDVPGVDFAPPPGVSRSRLPGHNARPTISHFEFDGRRRESLSWPSKDGTTSQSPASQHASASSSQDASSTDLLLHLYEVLELPGLLTDYHFAIQGCAGKLWERRRDEPRALADVERLSLLDIHLVEAHPNLFRQDTNEEHSLPGICGLWALDSAVRS